MLGNNNENGKIRPSREELAEEHSFDELARGLASGAISRNRALKLAGAALLGAVLAPLFPKPAEAGQGRRCKRSLTCTGKKENCTCSVPRFCGSGDSQCICVRDVEGEKRCGSAEFNCGETPKCKTNRECERELGQGAFCQDKDTGCCGQVCVPPCRASAASSARSTGSSNTGA